MLKTNNFMSFWYYEQAKEESCTSCHENKNKYLLRHRVFWGFAKPLFQIKTIYYLVCESCGDLLILDGEGKIAPYINKIKNQKPIKHLIQENKEENKSVEAWVKDHLKLK